MTKHIGTLSSVWREWIHWLVEFGIDANVVTPMPYDWRLPGPLLEKRDLYFYKLKFVLQNFLILANYASMYVCKKSQ